MMSHRVSLVPAVKEALLWMLIPANLTGSVTPATLETAPVRMVTDTWTRRLEVETVRRAEAARVGVGMHSWAQFRLKLQVGDGR